MSRPPVVVHIVTWNSARTVASCLESVCAQTGYELGENLQIAVTDNASTDETADIISAQYARQVSCTLLKRNVGFSEGHNLGIAQALERGAQHILVLNPDVVLAPNALATLADALPHNGRIGSATPKLLRAMLGERRDLVPVSPPVIDAAGMYITPSLRHLDRGSELPDKGQFDERRLVFGGTGAALLLSRRFIDDVAFRDHLSPNSKYEVFDERFFAYREDADLAWRGQWLGWQCLYVPEAVGYHERRVTPERRVDLPAEINAAGVRNRFLLQLNNLSLTGNLNSLIPGTFRNLIVIAGVFLRERSSIGALKEVVSGINTALRRRSELVIRRRTSARYMQSWFAFQPVAKPVLQSVSQDANTVSIRTVRAVIVSYNSGAHLEQCLQRLQTITAQLQDTIVLNVVVVDNGSKDPSITEIARRFQKPGVIDFVMSKENLGFAGAVNLGAKEEGSDALLVLNPDTEPEASAVRRLVETLDRFPKLGAVAPVLINADGSPQSGFTVRSYPTVGSVLAELFFLHRIWPQNPWTRSYRNLDDPFLLDYLNGTAPSGGAPAEDLTSPLIVEQPAGACLLVRSSLFREIGGFDTAFYPAWFEDVDLCRRIRGVGSSLAVVSDARVRHAGGHTVSSLTPSEFARAWYPNLLRYWWKHGSLIEYATVRIALTFALVIRAGAALLSGDRSKSIQMSSESSKSQARTLFRLARSPWSEASTPPGGS